MLGVKGHLQKDALRAGMCLLAGLFGRVILVVSIMAETSSHMLLVGLVVYSLGDPGKEGDHTFPNLLFQQLNLIE